MSLVSVICTEWAASQVDSFVSPTSNPALAELMTSYASAQGVAQHVTINVEENPLKAFMVRLFFPRLRKRLGRARWGTYFLNRRGLSDDLRDALAMWNSKVGYLYLVDGQCRIRWAANGEAREEEKESLVRCVRRLADEARGVQRGIRREEPRKPNSSVITEAKAEERQKALAAS